ncbi:MAG: adenosylcobinamide-GDP ribazoletransferase, partial [Rhodospirillaceae bacterium]|nr:adenosylcobinamide-GDP ribazoletransferase [Rhodospirillaceae bacterium]
MGEKKATTAKSKSSGLIAQVRAVWLFFTRLPFPLDFRPGAKKTAPPPLGSAARFFPLAGLVIGGLGALALWLGA